MLRSHGTRPVARPPLKITPSEFETRPLVGRLGGSPPEGGEGGDECSMHSSRKGVPRRSEGGCDLRLIWPEGEVKTIHSSGKLRGGFHAPPRCASHHCTLPRLSAPGWCFCLRSVILMWLRSFTHLCDTCFKQCRECLCICECLTQVEFQALSGRF